MKKNRFSFAAWLASKQAVSFCLMIGVLFLFTNYSHVIIAVNKEKIDFSYAPIVWIFLAHVDSFFFAFATCIVMFQATDKWMKILFVVFEAVMIFLNANANLLDSAGINSHVLLSSYVAIFSAFTLYYLGSLASQHQRAKSVSVVVPEAALQDQLVQEAKKHVNGNGGGMNGKKPKKG